MTDSQNLLAKYVQSGSEAAFGELLIRYLDLAKPCKLSEAETRDKLHKQRRSVSIEFLVSADEVRVMSFDAVPR